MLLTALLIDEREQNQSLHFYYTEHYIYNPTFYLSIQIQVCNSLQ